MTPDLLERLRLLEAWRKPSGPTPNDKMPNTYKTVKEAADALETLMEHAEAMAKVMARIGRAEPCHCARCTAMSEDARQSLASFRAAFPEVGE